MSVFKKLTAHLKFQAAKTQDTKCEQIVNKFTQESTGTQTLSSVCVATRFEEPGEKTGEKSKKSGYVSQLSGLSVATPVFSCDTEKNVNLHTVTAVHQKTVSQCVATVSLVVDQPFTGLEANLSQKSQPFGESKSVAVLESLKNEEQGLKISSRENRNANASINADGSNPFRFEEQGQVFAQLPRQNIGNPATAVEKSALEEISLAECKRFCFEAVKFVGLIPVDLAEMHKAFLQTLARAKHGDILPPLSLARFSGEYRAAELAEERAAILQAEEQMTPVEAEAKAGFPPIEEQLPSIEIVLDQQVLQEMGLSSSSLAQMASGKTKTPSGKNGPGKGKETPSSISVETTEEFRFADVFLPVGTRAELIHPEFREGLDPDDCAWLDLRADRVKALEAKVRHGDKEAHDQLDTLRADALILLKGRVRAIPRAALARVRDGPGA